MLGEDLSPWLIEINSSPSMCRNTRATVKLVDMVMEDTVKGNSFFVFLSNQAFPIFEHNALFYLFVCQLVPSPFQIIYGSSFVQIVSANSNFFLTVVLDRRLDKNADTGAFQLLYRAPTLIEPVCNDASFMVQGKKIRKKHHKR